LNKRIAVLHDVPQVAFSGTNILGVGARCYVSAGSARIFYPIYSFDYFTFNHNHTSLSQTSGSQGTVLQAHLSTKMKATGCGKHASAQAQSRTKSYSDAMITDGMLLDNSCVDSIACECKA
jgi:hypothetical protein